MMRWQKRAFDIAVAVVLILILAPVLLVIALAIIILDGRPVLFIGERMKSPTESFKMVKFRTMRPDPGDFGATGAHKNGRITRTGALLRKSRLDEIPQLWNILLGDMSFVGPRPPLRTYVERFPEVYDRVLQIRPGVTGLASIYYSGHEHHIMRNCATTEEADELYARVCIPRKMHLDLIYARHQSVCFDVILMIRTLFTALR